MSAQAKLAGLLSASVVVTASCHGEEPRFVAPTVASSTIADGDEEEEEIPTPTATDAGSYYTPDPQGRPLVLVRRDAPNMIIAALDHDHCMAELARRGVPFKVAEPTVGVMAPVRITGLVHGVSMHSALMPSQRDHSSSTVFDCRLAVALDDFASLAATKDIIEMVYFGAYRPKSANGCTPKYTGKQHCGGLAVDVASFKRKDGSVWNVEHDYHGKIGAATCGPAASLPFTDLRQLVCEAADRAIFHVILTANYNQQHFNHFHFEITPDAGWMLIH
jgi:hypothetical protein